LYISLSNLVNGAAVTPTWPSPFAATAFVIFHHPRNPGMTYEVQMHPWDSVQMHPWDSHLQNQGLGAPYFTSIPLSTLVMTGTASAQYVQQSSHRQDSPIKQEPPSQFLEGSQLRAASVKLEPESTRSPQAVKDWPAFDSGNHSLLIKGQVNNLSGNSERKQVGVVRR